MYDGSGRPPRRADVGIKGDRIAAVGNLSRASAPTIIDAKGQAVAPGFINMLSHSESSLIVDPRSLSELKQGITTQIFGEFSMGPLNDQMKQRLRERRVTRDIKSSGRRWRNISPISRNAESRKTSLRSLAR